MKIVITLLIIIFAILGTVYLVDKTERNVIEVEEIPIIIEEEPQNWETLCSQTRFGIDNCIGQDKL